MLACYMHVSCHKLPPLQSQPRSLAVQLQSHACMLHACLMSQAAPSPISTAISCGAAPITCLHVTCMSHVTSCPLSNLNRDLLRCSSNHMLACYMHVSCHKLPPLQSQPRSL